MFWGYQEFNSMFCVIHVLHSDIVLLDLPYNYNNNNCHFTCQTLASMWD